MVSVIYIDKDGEKTTILINPLQVVAIQNDGPKPSTIQVFLSDGDMFSTDFESAQRIVDSFKIKNGAVVSPEKT